MPQVLIIESCLINHKDDRGGVHAGTGEILDITKDTAHDLARVGRVLFINRDDDFDKNGRFTASPEMVKAAQAMAKAGPADAGKSEGK